MKLLTQWAVTSSALILIVLAVRVLFRDRLSARLRYALWGVVLLRLLIPFQVELSAPVSDSLPLLATNLAQDVSPWLEDQMLCAVPTQVYPNNGGVQPGEPPEYSRTLHSEADREYYFGGVRFDENGTTRYFFMMPASELLMMIWKTGAGLCLLAILYSNWGFSLRLGRRRRRLEDVDAPVPVYTAEGLPSPCLFGVLRPAVYVTPQAAEDPDTLRHVLAHELTHYAHKDHLWSLLRCFSLALHWYNPLVWLAVVLSKGDGELACDEGAVARLGEGERIPYGRTLVDMVAARSLRPGDLLSCSTAMTGGESSIKRRVTQIVKKPKTVKIALFAVIALVALGLVFVFVGRGERQSDLYGPYRSQVGRTQAVRYSPSPFSSQAYPDAITDPDLLEKALDILDHAADLLNTPEELGLELSDAPFVSPRVTLLEGPDGSGHTYLLYTAHAVNGDRCYLVTPAEMDAESYSVAAVLDTSAPGALELLARTQRSRVREDLTSGNAEPERVHPVTGAEEQSSLLGDLTPEQVAQVNEAFRSDVELPDGSWGPSEISCFFTSSYDDPTQIDLKEFLMYCPLREEVGNRVDPEEAKECRAVLAAAMPDVANDPEFTLPTPMWRYPREKISALLQKYAGVTVEELDWSGATYLEEYDAFYNFTSDFGPGVFHCEGGEISEDTVRLWSGPDGEGNRCELTLRKNGENWLIQSHHTIYER